MIPWSYSSLKQYLNCPKQYYEVRVAKSYESADTEQSLYGKRVHEIIEKFIRDGAPIPNAYGELLRHVPNIIHLFKGDKLKEFVEHKLALDISGNIVLFDSGNHWVRGIVDYFNIDSDGVASIIDWKTGSSNYADTRQLDLMSLLIFQTYPEVVRTRSMLYFIKNSRPIFGKDRMREDITEIWELFKPDLMQLQMSFDNDNWPLKPSGLCGWCPVDTCVHHRRR